MVEPRPGAGGKLAAQAVSTAAPDGYTHAVRHADLHAQHCDGLASYDIVKEFDPVAMLGLISYALVVNPNVPVHSVAELVALAKATPGKLNCASAGIGTVPHLACEYLNKVAGVNIVHVPYRDVNSATMASGRRHDADSSSAYRRAPSRRSYPARCAASRSPPQRSLLLPNLPTMVESGLSDLR